MSNMTYTQVVFTRRPPGWNAPPAAPRPGAAQCRTGYELAGSRMLRAPVLHAFVLLGTTCQLTTGPRLTMPASGGMPGGPVSTVTIQDFSFSPATLSVKVGSTVTDELEGGRSLQALYKCFASVGWR